MNLSPVAGTETCHNSSILELTSGNEKTHGCLQNFKIDSLVTIETNTGLLRVRIFGLGLDLWRKAKAAKGGKGLPSTY